MASTSSIVAYGWEAVPSDLKTLLKKHSESSGAAPTYDISSLSPPDTKLAKAVFEYAQKELPRETLHHSMRVWYYGIAILTHTFPTWLSPSFLETYYLTTLLHDIGTAPHNISSTHLSFEFHGGFLTHSLLSSHSTPTPQTESVVESIIRHQDLGSVGKLSRMGAITQLATIFDNMGENPELVSKGTIENVVKEWPRLGWSGCFAATIRRELELKPWAHTSHLGENAFPEGVEGNELMKPYDQTGL